MRKPIARERQFDNAAPIVFGVFTSLGVAYIIASKFMGIDAALVTIVPVLLMLAYAAMIVFVRGLRLRNDQTGDNFYYMGFIFTLVSLGVSLYQYSSGAGVDEIIRNFGIAIASTITGIVLRIMFNQLRRDPVEIEAVSRLELAEAARRVRRELDGVLNEISHFRRTNQQMIEEGFAESKAQLAALGRAAADTVHTITLSATNGLDGTVRELTGQYTSPDVKRQLDRSAKGLERINARLEEAGGTLASAAEGFASRLSQAQSPDKVVEVQMQPMLDRLEQVIGQATDRLVGQTGNLDRLTEQLLQSSRQTQHLLLEIGRATKMAEERQEGAQQRPGLFGRFRRTKTVSAAAELEKPLDPAFDRADEL